MYKDTPHAFESPDCRKVNQNSQSLTNCVCFNLSKRKISLKNPQFLQTFTISLQSRIFIFPTVISTFVYKVKSHSEIKIKNCVAAKLCPPII